MTDTPDAPSYVYPLPDHVDRVVWRGRYLHLESAANAGASPQAAVPAPSKATLAQVLRDGLAGALYCNRTWSAWQVGTMTEDDFSTVDESDTPEELADVVLALLAARPQAQPTPTDTPT